MAVKKPNFFKLILDLQKLAIPMKFMEEYGEELSDGMVTLNVRSGAVWEVKLVREKGRDWLQKGWSQFVEFYSISYGYFLVFTYNGKSAFNVLIFDMSCCEIEYPIVHLNTCEAKMKRKRKREDNISVALPSPAKKIPDKVFALRFRLPPDEKKRVEAYQCEYPSFVFKVSLSQISGKGYVNIPMEFARKYLKEVHGEFKLLGNVPGKAWSVVCTSFTSHVCLTIGWRSFAEDNELQSGDICVFELIKDVKTFKVGILPATGSETRKKLTHKLKVEAY